MATAIWQPTAAKAFQVVTVTIGGTAATNDEPGVSINGNVVGITVGTTQTTAAVAEGLAAAINASDLTSSLVESDQPRSAAGQLIPEFAEVTADYDSGSTFTVTAKVSGKPFTISGVADGSITVSPSTTTAATGPNHWDNADNWSGGSVPATDDTIVFADSDVSAKYGLPNGSLNPDLWRIESSFTGHLGLPPVNRDATGAPYAEYRQQYVIMDNDGSDTDGVLLIGEGPGQGSQLINIDWQAGVSDVTVYNTAAPDVNLRERACNLQVSAACNLNVLRGSVAVAPDVGDTGGLGTVNVGYVTSQANDVTLTIGPSADLTSQVLNVDGGQVSVYGALASATINQTAGVLRLARHTSETTTNYNGAGGELHFDGPRTVTNFLPGEAKVRLSIHPVTITNCTLTKGFSFVDRLKKATLSNGFDFYKCGVGDGELVYGTHYTLTPSSI